MSISSPRPAEPAQLVRLRSKELLGGQWRAEVGAAIAGCGDSWWTRSDLEGRLPEVPRSCVHKELSTLLRWGFISRTPVKSDRGEFEYQRVESSYWKAVVDFADQAEPAAPSSAVVRLSPGS